MPVNDDSLLGALTPRVVLGGFVAAIAVALVVGAVTSTVPFGAYNPGWDGTSTVRQTVDGDPSATPVVVDTTAYNRFDGYGTLVVILAPEEPYTDTDIARLRAFLDRGGTVLVAEDQQTGTNRLLAAIGASARVDGRSVRDPQEYYRDPGLAVISDVENTSITRGVDRFTINRGSVVRPGNATVIARTSEFAYLDRNGNEELDETEELRSYPVASTEPVGNGSVVVLSDPSVFINRMLEREGNSRLVGGLTTSYDRVVLDFSQRSGVPPTAVLWLWLRRTPWAQALLGLLGTGAVLGAVSERVRSQVGSIGSGRSGSIARGADPATLSPEERRQFIQRRHPEWDHKRVERIVEGINRVDTNDLLNTDE